MSINFRKWLCGMAKKGAWLYKTCDCQRYEPVPPASILVKVCAETHLVPNPPNPPHYCPEVVEERFLKGSEPTAVCEKHKKPVIVKTTQDILRERGYLIGASCYQGITYPLDVIEADFRETQKAGGTAKEMFVIFTWALGYLHQLHKIVGKTVDRNEQTGEILYGGYEFPVWDLELWNTEIQAKWRTVFALAKKYNLTLILRLHDFCSLKDGFEKRHYPFGSRTIQHEQGLVDSGIWAWDSNGQPHGFDESHKMGKYYRIFLNMFIPMVNESGCDYRIVPMNEADVLGDPESGRTERCVEWHKWHKLSLFDLAVSPGELIISTSRGYNEMKPWGYTMELHGVNSPQALQSVIDHFGTVNIFPNGDGLDNYAQGRVGDKPNKREPSVSQAIEMAKILKANGMKMYCAFQRPWDVGKRPGTDTDQDYYDWLRAMCGELKQ